MGKLTIWSGGVKIYPVDGSDEKPTMADPLDIPAQVKFDTCIYRATKEETRRVKTCCSVRSITGYDCDKIKRFPIKSEVCKTCSLYIARTEQGAK